MKFLVDANLPYKFAESLRKSGYDVVHTDDFPNKDRSTDKEIRQFSVNENRIVINKDSDFLDSHLVNHIPSKLLLISTGNITNNNLRLLMEAYFEQIVQLFNNYDLIELNNEKIIAHESL
jgi:predicted nuclease of predicted toxin-antitoxin system